MEINIASFQFGDLEMSRTKGELTVALEIGHCTLTWVLLDGDTLR